MQWGLVQVTYPLPFAGEAESACPARSQACSSALSADLVVDGLDDRNQSQHRPALVQLLSQQLYAEVKCTARAAAMCPVLSMRKTDARANDDVPLCLVHRQ